MFAFSRAARHAVASRVVLGLSEGQSYTPSDIKKAFREKALTAHPDAGGDVEYFRQLQGAYEELLREQGVSRSGNTTDATQSSTDGAGFGFYSHPHAQWANDRRTHRDYWQQVHEEELNMNTDGRGSTEHPSNAHYRAGTHRSTYGAGLGEEFASATQAHRGKHANFSTYYFYRPYESDYRTPYGTGFTEEEVQQAAKERRQGFFRAVARHTCLWSGLAFVIYLHECNNRVRRANEAREKGYKDPEYWRQLREEEQAAAALQRRPLRLENHWLDPAVSMARPPEKEEGQEKNAAESKAAQDVKDAQERRRRITRPPVGGVVRPSSGGGTQVVTYKGRPFTPNGVRAAGKTPPVTARTYATDVTYDVSDLDWDDEVM